MTIDNKLKQPRINRRQFLRGGSADSDMGGCLIMLGIGGLISYAVGACIYADSKKNNPNQKSIGYSYHPVDQVFRDHNGYRAYFSNEKQEYIEIKYYHLCIYKNQKSDHQHHKNAICFYKIK